MDLLKGNLYEETVSYGWYRF